MQDNLPELRDIHLPDGVSAFPPAYGWWVILGGIIAVCLFLWIVAIIRKKSKKLYALHLLQKIYSANNMASAVEMSEILRRICVYKYQNAATLFGQEWIDFLNQHCKTKLQGNTAELLINAPYIPHNTKKYGADDVANLRLFCQKWIGENL